jgi:hypothetical protein
MRFLPIFVLLGLQAVVPVLGVPQEKPVGGVPPRQLVPNDVMERARMAVQKLVDQVVRGNYEATLETMHPEFVKAISRPYGGPEKYKASMLKMMQQMGGNGIAIQAIITQAPETALEVDFGMQDVLVDGKPVLGADGKPKREGAYRSWMVFVPTVMDVFITDKQAQPPVMKKVRKWNFQVAISPKREENWTFISGSSINPLLLRKIFPFLPKDEDSFQFPKVKKPQILEEK